MKDKEENLKNYILLNKKEYEVLIKCKQKSEQYRNYILDNSNNNNLVKAMVTIEGKSFYKLIEESKEREEN